FATSIGSDGTFNSLRVTGNQTNGTVGYVSNIYWGTAATIGTAGIPLGSIYIQTGTASSSDYAGTSYYATSSGQAGTAYFATSIGSDGTFNSLRVTGNQTNGTVGYVANVYWGTAATIGTAGIPLGSIYIQTGTASSSDYAGTAVYATSAGQAGTASALISGAGSSGTIAIAGLTSIIVSNGIVTGWV
ncbi:MAG TPA: hypothetical protein ACFYEK_06095, partial [Candidatus Wunengus sp. YC60]